MQTDVALWAALSFDCLAAIAWVLRGLKFGTVSPPGHRGEGGAGGVREPRVPKPLVGVGADAKETEVDED